MIEEGEKAPAFELPSVDGGTLSLKDLRGSPVVLYSYPKDDTPGCAREACAFQDSFSAIQKTQKTGARVVGVSPESTASQERFRANYKLRFGLPCEADKSVATKYGAWGEKVLCGKKSVGMIRSTFVVDAHGVVRKVFPRVQVDGHVEKVLAELSKL